MSILSSNDSVYTFEVDTPFLSCDEIKYQGAYYTRSSNERQATQEDPFYGHAQVATIADYEYSLESRCLPDYEVDDPDDVIPLRFRAGIDSDGMIVAMSIDTRDACGNDDLYMIDDGSGFAYIVQGDATFEQSIRDTVAGYDRGDRERLEGLSALDAAIASSMQVWRYRCGRIDQLQASRPFFFDEY